MCSSDLGIPHLPRGSCPSVTPGLPAQADLAAIRSTAAAERVYESVEDLARALAVQATAFTPWRRRNSDFKPVVTGFIWTPAGPRKASILVDAGATHCFICAQVVDLLRLPAEVEATVWPIGRWIEAQGMDRPEHYQGPDGGKEVGNRAGK